MSEWITLGRMIYIVVFAGCFYYLVRGLPFRHNRLVSVAILTIVLYLLYVPTDSTLVNTMLRYVEFAFLYTIWAVIFLQVEKSYALYLSVFYIIFMGVWFSCVQILFSVMGWESSAGLATVAGICRFLSVILMKRFFIQVDAARTLTLHEIMISLFPAAACFVANLVLFDYMGSFQADVAADYGILVNVLVIFFGFSAMLVLVSSEQYFQMNRYKEENERARQQLHGQYQLFLREQENSSRLGALHHDMQNHLRTLEAMSGAGDVHAYIQELEKSIQELEPPVLTGSPTLDALLGIKKADCDRKGIELTCYIHLSRPDILSPMEICTLFGNCIDNAIEAVSDQGISEPYIHLSGGEVNGNMVIRIENPYAHVLQPRGGVFSTTKKDQEFHGYGLLNIRRIVEQKGGTVTFRPENGIFTVTWMIPVI